LSRETTKEYLHRLAKERLEVLKRQNPDAVYDIETIEKELHVDFRAAMERRWDALVEKVGVRYRDVTLENYQASNEKQNAALERIKAYAENIADEICNGRGVLLYGSTGTGKDHLLLSLSRVAIMDGFRIQWVNGVELFSLMREAMRTDASEEETLRRFMETRVLVLSDPMPPSGTLTDYQSATLYRLMDQRYRNVLPTWCSLNVAGASEARERMGAAIVDRLRDGALAIECFWESYRKAR
jgi:DNA replication protein DnaC